MAQASSDLHRLYLSAQGIKLNENGGFYWRGKSYGVKTKFRVAAAMLTREISLMDCVHQ